MEDKLLIVAKKKSRRFTRLKMILEIGNKKAVMLVVLSVGFVRFTSGSEFNSYAGLTPVIRQSGSSLK